MWACAGAPREHSQKAWASAKRQGSGTFSNIVQHLIQMAQQAIGLQLTHHARAALAMPATLLSGTYLMFSATSSTWRGTYITTSKAHHPTTSLPAASSTWST